MSEVPISRQAHVLQFADGTFRGQASTKVPTFADATLFTLPEARARLNQYDEGTVTIRPLTDFDLDPLRDYVAREMDRP